MDLQLTNRRVLISGATKGIGKATAERFLEEGARVAITARNAQAVADMAAQYPQDRVLAYPCDFTVEQQVQQLLAYLEKTWGGLDIAVANVGCGHSNADPVPDHGHFEAVMDVNLHAAMHLARYALPLLTKCKGNLVIIGSIAGMEAFGAPTAYATAKTALFSFAKNLALKTAKQGVRINCVAPGNIYFDDGTWGKKQRENPEDVQRMLLEQVPMQRFGTGREIADAVTFLASERAAFITGATLRVDGGQTTGLF